MEDVIRRAKELEEQINDKSARGVVDDSSDPDVHEAHDVIELSGSDSETDKKPPKKPTTIVKAYRSEPPLAQHSKRSCNAGAAAATEALATVSSLFHPSKIQEQEETQF
jgi:hypothetical protein